MESTERLKSTSFPNFPPLPVNATVVAPTLFASSIPFITFLLFPLVLKPITISSLFKRPSNCLEKTEPKSKSFEIAVKLLVLVVKLKAAEAERVAKAKAAYQQ